MATDQQEHLKIEQLHEHNPDELEVMAGRERENLEGWIPALANESETRDALEKAFDYRGDVTLTLKSGEVVEGYVYDRRPGKTMDDSMVRVMPAKGEDRSRRSIPYGEIAAVNFTGRDTAAGKTFDAWVKKYWEKKNAGEKNIQIEPEKLD
jgi:transcriptional antiterminator Rof (Rho-off)